tara:strand:- start:94 stop:408 length:315 start_codon:yes stop_codon:yes gene_type:complete
MEGYRFSLLAVEDLDDIFDYTYDKWGVDQARHYSGLVKEGVAELLNDPMRPKSRKRDDLLKGCRFYRVQHHYLVYRVKNGLVEIGRVLHEQMNFEDHISEEAFQ